MRIVIEISNTLKEIIDSHDIITASHFMWVSIMMDAIENGTPLPKGHGRLIDAEVFTNNVIKYSHQSTKTIGQALADTPTIIEADKAERSGEE